VSPDLQRQARNNTKPQRNAKLHSIRLQPNNDTNCFEANSWSSAALSQMTTDINNINPRPCGPAC